MKTQDNSARKQQRQDQNPGWSDSRGPLLLLSLPIVLLEAGSAEQGGGKDLTGFGVGAGLRPEFTAYPLCDPGP